MKHRITVGIIAAVLVLAASMRAQNRTVWDGVYSERQLQRGEKLYADQCSTCHGADMKAGAGAPSLAGPEFTFGWDKKPVGALFDFIKANMPPGQPGGLKDQEYADILSAILKRNGFPSSPTADLPTTKDALDAITFVETRP